MGVCIYLYTCMYLSICIYLYICVYIYRRRRWHPSPVLLPGKSHGWRSLVGCSPWGHEESDMTEQLCFHFSLSCVGGGNGNPLQCSCLENRRAWGAWWAAVSGVAQSQTRLKRLSSSSSSVYIQYVHVCTYKCIDIHSICMHVHMNIHIYSMCMCVHLNVYTFISVIYTHIYHIPISQE